MSKDYFVAIIKYGGNTHSISQALGRIGVKSAVIQSPHDTKLNFATHIILPGVGAAPSAMRQLQVSGLNQFLVGAISSNIPILGICLGMQLLFESSSEGGVQTRGLGVFSGHISKLKTSSVHKVPNVGWRTLSMKNSTKMFDHVPEPYEFFFINAFGSVFEEQHFVTSVTQHSVSICASVELKRTLGVQFHPELSGENGLQFLSNFIFGS